MSVAFAVRASISIPGVFVPMSRLSEDQELVDGGVLLNFPVQLVQDKAKEAKCPFIGVRFDRPLAYLESPRVGTILKRTVELMLRRGSLAPEEVANDPNYIPIEIDTSGFKSRDFDMSQQQKQELVRRGVYAAKLALKGDELRTAGSTSIPRPVAYSISSLENSSADHDIGNQLHSLLAHTMALGERIDDIKDRRNRGRIDEGRYTDLVADLDRERREILQSVRRVLQGRDIDLDTILRDAVSGEQEVILMDHLAQVAQKKGLDQHIVEALNKRQGSAVFWLIEVGIQLTEREDQK